MLVMAPFLTLIPAVFSPWACFPQLGDGSNGVEASVLRQSVGNDLESLSEGLEAVGVSSSESISVLHQFPGYFSLRSSTSSNEEPLLDQAPDDAQSIVEGAVRLLDHQLVGPR